MSLDAAAVDAAARRLAPHVRRTPVFETAVLGPSLHFKAEHLQVTSSFKFRGATNRLLVLAEETPDAEVYTASTGNHGIGVATAGSRLGVAVRVFVARDTDAAIEAQLVALGAQVERIASDDCADAEREARARAADAGAVFVSPYNDAVVAAGQGTIAVELHEQLAALVGGVDVIVIAVGGGGLISGNACWLAEHAPGVRVVGAQPAVDAAMAASVRAGRIVDVEGGPTLSHSTAGGIETDAITFEPCRDLVADWLLVEEDEIAETLSRLLFREHQLVEGAAAVAFAAGARIARAEPDARVCVVSCGARLTPDELARIPPT